VRARPLPFEELRRLPSSRRPLSEGGPACPRNAIVAGAWWLTRESELASARAQLVEILPARGALPLRARWHLPSSKTDQRAMGVARTHECSCPDSPDPGCPVHAIWDQLLWLQRTFPDRWRSGVADISLPLFPTVAGEFVKYEPMVRTIQAAAVLLGVPLSAPDGSERVSGHSLRSTGAQGLARRGAELWTIQLLGRWGGSSVQLYVREAQLDRASALAARPSSTSLAELIEDVTRRVLQQVSEGLPTAESIAAAVKSLSPAPSSVMAGPSIQEPLTDVIERAMLEPPSASGSASTSAGSPSSELACRVVVNQASGCCHRVLLGPPGTAVSRWVAACGWRFGLSPRSAFSLHAVIPPDIRARCCKCNP